MELLSINREVPNFPPLLPIRGAHGWGPISTCTLVEPKKAHKHTRPGGGGAGAQGAIYYRDHL